jgi:hypothetical protein
MEDDLGVSPGAEDMPTTAQLCLQLDKIIDFAVVHDPVAAARVGHGHMAGLREVDDAETVRPQAHVPKRDETAIIGAPMMLQIAHLPDEEDVFLFVALPLEADQSGDGTHT